MNFHDAQTGRVIKQHYEKLLLAYDVYETGIYEEQADSSDTKKASHCKIGNWFLLRCSSEIITLISLSGHAVESNGTVKSSNKRKESSPKSDTKNIDPVRLEPHQHRSVMFFSSLLISSVNPAHVVTTIVISWSVTFATTAITPTVWSQLYSRFHADNGDARNALLRWVTSMDFFLFLTGVLI